MSEKVVCTICGKTLKSEASLTKGIGHRCDTLREQGWTSQKLQAHYAEITAAAPPEGYVKLATFHQLVKKHREKIPGLTVSKVVKAIGKDRGIEKPLHPIARPVYVGGRKTRWVHPWLATAAGLKAIASGDFSKAPTE